MIHRIAPQFFTSDMDATPAYYAEKLGFECDGTWGDPVSCAIAQLRRTGYGRVEL